MSRTLLLVLPPLLLLLALLAIAAVRQAAMKKLGGGEATGADLLRFTTLMEAQSRLAAPGGPTPAGGAAQAADLERELAFERLFAVVLGSQLELLQFLLGRKVRAAPAAAEDVRRHFDLFVRRSGMQDFPPAAWLRLLTAHGLAALGGAGEAPAITPRGEAFLRYVLQAYPGLSRTRPF